MDGGVVWVGGGMGVVRCPGMSVVRGWRVGGILVQPTMGGLLCLPDSHSASMSTAAACQCQYHDNKFYYAVFVARMRGVGYCGAARCFTPTSSCSTARASNCQTCACCWSTAYVDVDSGWHPKRLLLLRFHCIAVHAVSVNRVRVGVLAGSTHQRVG